MYAIMQYTLVYLSSETPKTINFLFFPDGKLMVFTCPNTSAHKGRKNAEYNAPMATLTYIFILYYLYLHPLEHREVVSDLFKIEFFVAFSGHLIMFAFHLQQIIKLFENEL